ncbi:MAG TPA: class I SAM-dependent methyltransferase [Bacteroidia bacterium]|nr:class I SAM-dependent methyltransferase [Bacteroidia bacterium]
MITNRFSDRVDNYVKYRPHYPAVVIDFLKTEKIISGNSVIADIGSGTGISAELFLKNGYKVFGIEPNEPMRQASKIILQKYSDKKLFVSVNATAEQTTMPNKSVDVIVCAQAFHWFNNDAFKNECKRILKPNGHIVLMWNDRRTDTTDFLKVYEDFLQMFGTDYLVVNHKNTQDKKIFENFFGKENYDEKDFYNYQDVDFDGLKGRVLSSSYMPNEGHKDFEHMIYCLRKIFNRYQENNLVRLDYDTKIYYGQLK